MGVHGLFRGDETVRHMALVRYISASIEITAATVMLRYGRIETALAINSALGLVGPILFAVVSALGIAGLAAGQVNVQKIGIIFLGIVLVLYGALR